MKVYNRVGLFGGSFNPIHLGHIKLINNFIEKLNLDVCFIIPTFQSPFKTHLNYQNISNQNRLDMIKLAINDNTKILLECFEINKSEISYTIDTVNYILSQYNPNELFLHIGTDQIPRFKEWKSWQDIASICVLAISERDEYKYNEISSYLVELEKIGKKPIMLNNQIIQISSTMIRDKIHKNEKIYDLVPTCVENYIKLNNLYID